MLQFVPIPAKDIKAGDKVLNIFFRKCDTVSSSSYDGKYYTIKYTRDGRQDEVSSSFQFQVLIDIESTL